MKRWIEKNLITNNKVVGKRCNKTWFVKNNFTNQYDEIISHTKFLNDLSQEASMAQRIWHIHNDINHLYKCNNPNCNNSPQFFSFSRGYLRTCCPTCAQHDPQTVDKIKSTNIKKYGVEYGLSSKEIIKKKNQTVKEKYGVDNVSQLKDVSDKKKQTCLKNYGVEWILSDQSKKEKAVYEKYGIANVRKLKSVQDKISNTRRGNFFDYLINSDRLKNRVVPLFSKDEYVNGGYYSNYKFRCCKCNNEFLDCLEDGDIPRCSICYKNSSVFEKEITDFVRNILKDKVVEENNRHILNKGEVDIFIPSEKIAIECDGLFWHGEINGSKDKRYHLNKTEECLKQNIKLIHIFEDEWLFNKSVVENRLRYILGMESKKVYARNCKIESINSDVCIDFLKRYHSQGKDNSNIKLGLFHDNELVSVMTFGSVRKCLGSSGGNEEYELYRFCNKNINVVGGFSKLLNHFIKNFKPAKIISYVDRRWNDGKTYESIGFKFVRNTEPNYWYFGKGKSYKRYHRFNFAKHTLSKKLKNFDPNLSEWENMKNNGWDRIWDCGNLKYELICG